jgi:hypothetical protein
MSNSKRSRRGPRTFDDVRENARSLPVVEETTAYGMPAFKAGETRFAGKPVERSDIEPNTLGVSVSFEERGALIAARPDVYYVTPHFANYPAVLARLTKLRRAELRELLGKAWRHAMERQAPASKKRRAAAPSRRPRR